MYKKIVLTALLLCTIIAIHAQESLVGRTYYNKNVMEKLIDEALNDAEVQQKLKEARDSAYIKAEIKAGRPLTTKEKEKLDTEIEEAMKMMDAMRKGLSTAITVEFKSETQLVMKMDMKMDDEVMKAAGIPWAKRKLMKAAMAMMPAQKATYIRQGNIIISTDGKDKDTLTISNDGMYLTGKADEKMPFTLTRIK